MPNHSSEHMAMLSKESAAKRRATKLAQLILTSPPLSRAETCRLQALLEELAAADAGVPR